MSLISEIILRSAELESRSVSQIDVVGLSLDAIDIITSELFDELDGQSSLSIPQKISEALTLNYVIIPEFKGVDYKFFVQLM